MLLICRMKLEMNGSQISSFSKYWSVCTPRGQGVLCYLWLCSWHKMKCRSLNTCVQGRRSVLSGGTLCWGSGALHISSEWDQALQARIYLFRTGFTGETLTEDPQIHLVTS